MAPSDLILAVDQGSSATKALLVSEDGSVVATATTQVASTFPHPGWVEQAPLEIWRGVQTAVAACLHAAPAARVSAVALTNQRESLLLWDRRTGEPLSPLIGWQDQRTQAYCDTLRPFAGPIVNGERPVLGATFYAPGAPRMAWGGVRYRF